MEGRRSKMSPAGRIGGQAAHERRGAADCGEHRQAAGANVPTGSLFIRVSEQTEKREQQNLARFRHSSPFTVCLS